MASRTNRLIIALPGMVQTVIPLGLSDKPRNILDRLLALRNTGEILEYIDMQKHVLSKSKRSG